MRILTICEGGTVRSVGLARVLKDETIAGYSHDAIAASWRWNTPETLEGFCEWADMIVVMEPYMEEKLPPEYLHRSEVCDVGPDLYRHALDDSLIEKCIDWCMKEVLPGANATLIQSHLCQGKGFGAKELCAPCRRVEEKR